MTAAAASRRAERCWGEALPDWVRQLAREADAGSQARAAARIGFSPAVVSLVLSNTYHGRLDRIEAAVRATLVDPTVDCPALGPIPIDRCGTQRRRPFSTANPESVRLWRACQSCPRNRA